MTVDDIPSQDRPTIARAAVVDDHPAMLALNNAATPHVNALTAGQFAWLAAESDFQRVVERHGTLAGFALAIRAGTTYWSGNYTWFTERYDDFLYLDRIVVVPDAQRSGVGTLLYHELVAFAAGRWPRIALEVNVQPPNPGSLAFHHALGFRQVGSRRYDGNEVAMFERLV